ncbi:hypothetical protein [Morganella morganii]|nr:hypothetical protein [Morganella morganii]AVK38755.1 hypothetical protein CSB69_3705 [Morganella morganii]
MTASIFAKTLTADWLILRDTPYFSMMYPEVISVPAGSSAAIRV